VELENSNVTVPGKRFFHFCQNGDRGGGRGQEAEAGQVTNTWRRTKNVLQNKSRGTCLLSSFKQLHSKVLTVKTNTALQCWSRKKLNPNHRNAEKKKNESSNAKPNNNSPHHQPPQKKGKGKQRLWNTKHRNSWKNIKCKKNKECKTAHRSPLPFSPLIYSLTGKERESRHHFQIAVFLELID